MNSFKKVSFGVCAAAFILLGGAQVASAQVFTQDLGIGSTGTEVTKLQERLLAEGLLASDVKATGYYGALTEEAVVKFQQLYTIDMTGTVGPKTRAILNGTSSGGSEGSVLGASTFNFTQNLVVGSTGEEVTKLQERLLADGLLASDVTPTGYFGSLTEGAVKKFQELYGIEMTGTVGPLTRAALNK
ncbi:MAG: hypothetical protein A2408_04010 [Candidatus Yonathbacteria bacterium RIFOXYC1_FULL_52_10]|nr:MAG: hypothetical protein A2408_04010 [Candidatus Yonathbacteria bacterium RIFOXYC1_FULL_52_10]